eukprot:398831-Pleurochrysis_carterae.AAC.1
MEYCVWRACGWCTLLDGVLEDELRELRALSAAGLAADDEHAMRAQRSEQLLAACVDRQPRTRRADECVLVIRA